jgi:hypothetical protein
MLPQPTLITSIPELTVRVAQAAFPKGPRNSEAVTRRKVALQTFAR